MILREEALSVTHEPRKKKEHLQVSMKIWDIIIAILQHKYMNRKDNNLIVSNIFQPLSNNSLTNIVPPINPNSTNMLELQIYSLQIMVKESVYNISYTKYRLETSILYQPKH